MKTKQMIYQQLEFTPNSTTKSKSNQWNVASWLGKIWNFAIDALTKEPEIKVW